MPDAAEQKALGTRNDGAHAKPADDSSLPSSKLPRDRDSRAHVADFRPVVAGAGPLPKTARDRQAVGRGADPRPVVTGAGPLPKSSLRAQPQPAGGNAADAVDAPPASIALPEPPRAVWRFDPPALAFSRSGEERFVKLTNTSDQPETISQLEFTGDEGFSTGMIEGLEIEPGQTITVDVLFSAQDAAPHAATLVVHTDDTESSVVPGRLQLGAITSVTSTDTPVPSGAEGAQDAGSQAGANAGQTCGVAIAARTSAGKANDIDSALISVSGAWASMLLAQSSAVGGLHSLAVKESPAATSKWQELVEHELGEALKLGIGAVSLYVGAGLAVATWEAFEASALAEYGPAAAKKVADLTMKLHAATESKLSGEIAALAVTKVAELARSEPNSNTLVCDAFFQGQINVLAQLGSDAQTALDNHQGDFAAIEAEHPGAAFAVLEAYRNHLMCNLERAAQIQRNKTLGLWAGVLASLKLGTHDPAPWEQTKDGKKPAVGADLDQAIGASQNERHDWRHALAGGVLDIGVIWDYDHKDDAPIRQVTHARIQGLNKDLKALLTTAPLGQFPIPVIVSGEVLAADEVNATAEKGSLRVGRNDGGAFFGAATARGLASDMLSSVGPSELLAHVDTMTLDHVD